MANSIHFTISNILVQCALSKFKYTFNENGIIEFFVHFQQVFTY